MRLLITVPTAVVIDETDVTAIRAEDESGSFGIMNGHADLLTALNVCIVSWKGMGEKRRYCAVRRGVLSVNRAADGTEVAIATREAVSGDSLKHLEQVVLDEFRQRQEAERAARTDSLQLQIKAVRQIMRFLRPGRPGQDGGSP